MTLTVVDTSSTRMRPLLALVQRRVQAHGADVLGSQEDHLALVEGDVLVQRLAVDVPLRHEVELVSSIESDFLPVVRHDIDMLTMSGWVP